MVSGFVSTPGNYQELISDILRHKMNKIEVTPAKVLTARLGENRERNAQISNQVYYSSLFLPAPELPRCQSTSELFNSRKPWWTKYDEELWIPEILLFSIIERKLDASPEKYNTKTVYWAERIDDVTKRYGLWPRSTWPKQKSSFFEQGFAIALLGDINSSNLSSDPKYNKNSYQIAESASEGFYINIYSTFLERLISTHKNNRKNQKMLRKYFDK